MIDVRFVLSRMFSQFILVLVLFQILLITLYGLWDDGKIDLALSLLLLLMTLEVFTRILCIGPTEYWHWANYHGKCLLRTSQLFRLLLTSQDRTILPNIATINSHNTKQHDLANNRQQNNNTAQHNTYIPQRAYSTIQVLYPVVLFCVVSRCVILCCTVLF
jgi:hypothetical protein